jgi:glycosyltransferase involved in cell wall biosynthesis
MNIGKPLVSTVVAAYNSGQFVAAAVKSVLAQTMDDLDVHVVNDGSTDDTDEQMAPLLADPRVTYHKQRNLGQAAAKNRGIRESRGTYIAFCDADDMWTADKLASQLPIIEGAADVGLAFTRCAKIDESGRLLSVDTGLRMHRGRVTRQLIQSNFVPGATTLLRRSYLDAVGMFDESMRMGIDWDLWLRLSRVCSFDYVDEPKYLYRMWSGQMSNNWRGRYESNFYILKKFFGAFPQDVPDRERRLVWATQLVERARARARVSGEYASALRDCLQAGLTAPTYTPAWKSMVRVLLWAARIADPAEEDWAKAADPEMLARVGQSLLVPGAGEQRRS